MELHYLKSLVGVLFLLGYLILMGETSEFRTLSDKQIAKLSEEEILKIERVCNALNSVEQAEANKESEKKLRVLFERAPHEMLPFIVYCVYVGATGLIGFVYLINNFKDMPLYILLAVLLIILFLPLLVLPKLNVVGVVKSMLSGKQDSG